METGETEFTFSVPGDLEKELAGAKQEFYSQCTWGEMLRDLIGRGLRSTEEGRSPGEDRASGRAGGPSIP